LSPDCILVRLAVQISDALQGWKAHAKLSSSRSPAEVPIAFGRLFTVSYSLEITIEVTYSADYYVQMDCKSTENLTTSRDARLLKE
jgi:hypothetical protein